MPTLPSLVVRQHEDIQEHRRDFEHGIWEVYQQGPEPGTDAAKELDSDEDLVLDNSNQLAPNNTCPLTLLPVRMCSS